MEVFGGLDLDKATAKDRKLILHVLNKIQDLGYITKKSRVITTSAFPFSESKNFEAKKGKTF